MSIILHTGVPGAGKSYYMVYELLLGDVQKKYFVLHNIDGLKPEYFDSKDIRDWTTLTSEDDFKSFFTRENMKKISDEAKEKFGKNLLIVIDECQNWLDKSDPEVKKFLSWHRHEDIDIWLCCQGESMIARDYRALVEYTIQGNKSSVLDHFIYTFKVKRTQFRVRKLPKNEAVFRAYRSFAAGAAEKKTSKLLMVGCIFGVVGVLLMMWSIFFGLPKSFAKEKDGKKDVAKPKQTTEVLPKPEAPSVSTPKARVDKATSVASGTGVDWSKFTLSSVMGDQVSVQDSTGRIHKVNRLAPGVRFLRYEAGCVQLLIPQGGIEHVCKQIGLVKVEPREPAGAGGWGGGGSATPADAGKSLPK
ncbi:MAG: hypothetical protein LLG06_13540 [Desulfobacteraceae bacterium]|nr:hypothetical protein [Desulfobacteraceae bacterium]